MALTRPYLCVCVEKLLVDEEERIAKEIKKRKTGVWANPMHETMTQPAFSDQRVKYRVD